MGDTELIRITTEKRLWMERTIIMRLQVIVNNRNSGIEIDDEEYRILREIADGKYQ